MKKYSIAFILCSILVICTSWTPLFAQTKNLKDLIDNAKKNEKQIAVFYHGSDWCVSGEMLLKSFWNNPKFKNQIEEFAILEDYDVRENQQLIEKNAVSSLLNSSAKEIPLSFAQPLSQNGANFDVEKEGTFFVSGNNPKSDRYTLIFTPKENVKNPILRLRIMKDSRLPKNGPGRATDGRIALSQILIQDHATKPLKINAIQANTHFKDQLACSLLNQKSDPKTFWGVESTKNDLFLFVSLTTPLKAGEAYELFLFFNSNWANAAFGKFQLSLFDDASSAKQMRDCMDYSQDLKEMQPLRQGFNDGFPAIVMYDDQKRQLGSIVCLDQYENLDEIVQKIQKIAEATQNRDRYFKRAETQSGEPKAASLAMGLISFDGIISYHQIRNIYKSQWEQIKKLDPKDISGYQQKLESPYGRLVSNIRKLTVEDKFEEAETLYKKSITHPKNFRFSPEQRQELVFAGFYLYKAWRNKDNTKESMLWDVLKETAKIAPTSHIGLGARGYLSMNGQGELMIPHGIFPKHLKDAQGTLIITEGISRIVNHPGDYKLNFSFRNGKSVFEICSVSLLIDGKVIFKDELFKSMDVSKKEVTIPFKVDQKPSPNAKFELRINGRSLNGNDCRIEIGIRPTLD